MDFEKRNIIKKVTHTKIIVSLESENLKKYMEFCERFGFKKGKAINLILEDFFRSRNE